MKQLSKTQKRIVVGLRQKRKTVVEPQMAG